MTGIVVVELSPDRQSFTIRRRNWSGSYPIAALPDQISFYRRLWSRGSKRPGEAGPFGPVYEPTVVALEVLQKRLAGERA